MTIRPCNTADRKVWVFSIGQEDYIVAESHDGTHVAYFIDNRAGMNLVPNEWLIDRLEMYSMKLG